MTAQTRWARLNPRTSSHTRALDIFAAQTISHRATTARVSTRLSMPDDLLYHLQA